MIFPNHKRAFTGADAAAPPIEAPAEGVAVDPGDYTPTAERLPDPQYRNRHFHDSIISNPGAVTVHVREELQFEAKSMIVSNTSGSTIQIDGTDIRIPPATNLVIALRPYVDHYTSLIFASATGAGELDVVLTEERFNPTTQFPATLSAASGVSITGPFGQALMAASFPVVIASNQSSLPVTISSAVITATQGAQHHAGSVVNLLGASIPVLAARSGATTRSGGYIRARKTNAGNATIDGAVLLPGDTLNLTGQDLYTCQTNTSGDVLDVYEEWT